MPMTHAQAAHAEVEQMAKGGEGFGGEGLEQAGQGPQTPPPGSMTGAGAPS